MGWLSLVISLVRVPSVLITTVDRRNLTMWQTAQRENLAYKPTCWGRKAVKGKQAQVCTEPPLSASSPFFSCIWPQVLSPTCWRAPSHGRASRGERAPTIHRLPQQVHNWARQVPPSLPVPAPTPLDASTLGQRGDILNHPWRTHIKSFYFFGTVTHLRPPQKIGTHREEQNPNWASMAWAEANTESGSGGDGICARALVQLPTPHSLIAAHHIIQYPYPLPSTPELPSTYPLPIKSYTTPQVPSSPPSHRAMHHAIRASPTLWSGGCRHATIRSSLMGQLQQRTVPLLAVISCCVHSWIVEERRSSVL